MQLDRSYVFGRILAYAYRIENYSYFLAGHKFRETNASKYLTQYTNTPAKVLLVLQRRLVPYKSKIGNTIYGRQLTEEMDRLVASLSKEDMTNKPLTENFLLGYHAQLSEFYRKRKDIDIDGTIT